MVNAWPLTRPAVVLFKVDLSVGVSSRGQASPFSFRILSTRNYQAAMLLLPVAIDPASFSIEWLHEV